MRIVPWLALLGAVERGRSWGWGSAATITAFAVAAIAGAAFIVIERRVEHPLIPIRYFALRNFTVPIVLMFFAQLGYMGGFILAPRLLAEVSGEQPGHISNLLIPRPLAFALVGVAAGAITRVLGLRIVAVVGTAFVAGSLWILAATVSDLSTWVVVASIALSGLGMGLVQPAITASVANSVDNSDLGVAGATQQMSVQVATSLGMNLLDSAQAAWVATVGLASSYANAYYLGAAITAVGVIAALFLPRRSTTA